MHGNRDITRGQLARFLFTRGLWLIVLELTLFHFYWSRNLDFSQMGGFVLWALGCSMIVLSVLVYLPLPVTAGFGLVLIAGHNAFDSVSPYDVWPTIGGIWAVLHGGALVPVGSIATFFPAYPLVPWIGVMAVGYCFGAILQLDRPRRRAIVFVLGVVLIAAFHVLRGLNGYGDPNPWVLQEDFALAACTIGNCTKYPPSLCYLLMTLGPALIFLAATDCEPGWLRRRFIVFGRVPLFFYLLHLPLILVFAFICAWMQLPYREFDQILKGPRQELGSLPLVYGVWAAVILILYPICAWYAGFKQRHPDWWIRTYL